MRFLTAGERGLLVELDGLDEVVALHEDLRRDPLAGVIEMVPAARTVLIVFDPALTAPDRLTAQVGGRAATAAEAASAADHEHVGREHRSLAVPEASTEASIPVVYDGPDLAEVAERTGLTVDEVVDRHLAARYQVAFCGFAPGFAYLTGLDPQLMLPRRSVPRTRVPAGSVALSDRFTSVYPHASPGGWHLLGRTDAVIWDTVREPPALLPPGTRVRFVRVDG
jgi:KipI family sensor histidine kinase inhibitor